MVRRGCSVQLVTDAAETYDRRIRLQNQQRQQREHNQHMHVKNETTYHEGHKGQVHATTTVFEPTPTSNVSDDDIFDMDYESDEEAFPAQVLLNMNIMNVNFKIFDTTPRFFDDDQDFERYVSRFCGKSFVSLLVYETYGVYIHHICCLRRIGTLLE